MRGTIQVKKDGLPDAIAEGVPLDLSKKREYHLKIPPKVF
jgi:hypothetical protein